MKKINILCVIDDDSVYHYTVQKTVEHFGFAGKVMKFFDGESAIQFFSDVVHRRSEQDLPDVILLDLNMPVMDGWDFLEEYILLRPHIGKPILVYIVSSSVHQRDLERAKTISEVSDYLIKPITDTHFRSIIDELN